MTDNEIIKALECCGLIGCKECPYCNEDGCQDKLCIAALGLINCQKAEIESLNEKERILIFQLYEEREKAIKEFAERLKEEFHEDTQRYNESTNLFIRILTSTIDVLVKEMTEKGGAE